MCLNFSRYGHRGLGPGSVKSSLDWIDVFLHGQLAIQDDTEIANAGGGTDDVIPDLQFEVDVFHLVTCHLLTWPTRFVHK